MTAAPRTALRRTLVVFVVLAVAAWSTRRSPTGAQLARSRQGLRLAAGGGRRRLAGRRTVLPPGTARADVAADGGDTEARFRKAPLVPLEARSFGEDGRFVAQPAPADPGWQDQDATVVDLQ